VGIVEELVEIWLNEVCDRMVMSHVMSQHVIGSHMTGIMRTVGGEVHSHNSTCIYSVENQMGTLSSFSC